MPLNQTQQCDSSTNPLELASQIALRYTQKNATTPVTQFRTPQELEDELDLELSASGESIEDTMQAVEELINATPRSTSNKFYNQLFGGQDLVTTAADMLAPVVNTSLYTFKAAGPMALIERKVIQRMAGIVGYDPDEAEGVFTPGGSISNLVAMLLARNEACPEFRNEGSGGKTVTCYVSIDAHYSVVKSAGIIGIGRNSVRLIPTDSNGRMKSELLRQAIEDDLQSNCVPGMIIATAGTTVRGAFDPINDILPIAQTYNIWLHVDASYGGSAALSPKHKHLLEGTHLADSVAWNPHKVMGMPLSVAALITRKPGSMRRSLDETADYLFQSDDNTNNPGTRSIQCGRRNDALKIWAGWKHHGDNGYRDRMDHLMDLAQHFTNAVTENSMTTLACQPEFINVCFEVIGKPSRDICETLRKQGKLLVGHAVVNERRIIRVPFVNAGLTTTDLDEMLETILSVANTIPAGENAVPNHVNQTTGTCCQR